MTSSQGHHTEPKAIPSELNPEQALGLVGLGMMQKISRSGAARLRLVEEAEGKCDLNSLRDRLELISLAIETGAPLSTNEVSHLLGARPGNSKAERGGLIAQRISRNVWKLSRVNNQDSSYWRN